MITSALPFEQTQCFSHELHCFIKIMIVCFQSVFINLQNLHLVCVCVCVKIFFCTDHSKRGCLVLSLSVYSVEKPKCYYTSNWLNQHSIHRVEATYGVLMLCGEGQPYSARVCL